MVGILIRVIRSVRDCSILVRLHSAFIQAIGNGCLPMGVVSIILNGSLIEMVQIPTFTFMDEIYLPNVTQCETVNVSPFFSIPFQSIGVTN